MKVNWQVQKKSPDCGVYLMRHMESYMGDAEIRWESGLLGKQPHDKNAIDRLRYKYMYGMLTSDLNMQKDKVMLESEAYDNLDLWEKTIKLDEYAKSKKKKKPRRKA